MRLNTKNLRNTLVTILGVDPDYVVPKQGNWFNPQGTENSAQKPRTWCAFRINGERNVTLAHYTSDATPKNYSVVHKTGQLSLQFVGDKAEDLANSVAHWIHRQDVQDAFAVYDGKIFAKDRKSVV